MYLCKCPVSVLITVLMQSPGSGSLTYTGVQYSETRPSADNKMALTDFGSLRSVVSVKSVNYCHECGDKFHIHYTLLAVDFPQMPNAPPAYEKISSGPLPPPYSP